MSTEQYLKELATNLKGLSQQEINDAISFYREYAEDAAFNTYEEMVNHFGPAKILASKIYSESATKVMDKTKPAYKDNFRALSLTLLALLSLPFSFPLAMIIFALGISAFVSSFAILVSFGFTAIALFVAGFASIFYFSFTFLNPFALGSILKSIGGGLILIAIAIVFTLIVANMLRLISKLVTKITSNIVRKVSTHE